MQKRGKEHGRQMTENAENAGFCLQPSFLGYLIENASRYKVEKLLQADNIRAGGFFVHTPTQWQGSFLPPAFFGLFRHPWDGCDFNS